jgi:hypothetical protein
MELSNQAKTILMLGVVMLLIYFVFNSQSSDSSNSVVENLGDEGIEEAPQEEAVEEVATNDSDLVIPQENEVANRMRSRNSAMNGEYRKHSYAEGARGNNGISEWENHFNTTNDIIGSGMGGNSDEFVPMDDGAGDMAMFREDGGARLADQNQDVNDVMNSSNLMPGEVRKDWYEVMDEPVSVKNHHLIAVTRPYGVNTIGTSNKNQSHDIRGDEACPRFNAGPFLNSSIEPNPYPSRLQMTG